MWPGDANNNGKVNAVDLLFVGLGYNAKGPLRPNASTRWEVQNFNVWSQSFPNGLNYAFADGNGDGEIDDKDNKDVIEVNFGLTHGSLRPNGFVKGQKGSAPQLKLSTTQRVVAPGSTIFVDLDLGDAAHPLDFYGIAVQMGYTSRLVRSSEFEDEVTPWFEATGEDTKDLYATPGNNGQAELAITRIDQQAIKGFGRMGKIKLVIEDIIVGRPVDTLRITIDSVLLIDKNLKSTAVAHDTLLIFVTKNPALVGTKELRQDPSLLQISPNPSNGDFWIKTPLGIKHWEVYDPLGRLISVHTQAQGIGQWKIHTGAQVPGVYLLRGTGEQGFVSKSILLAPFY
jgi:hypothetical protein